MTAKDQDTGIAPRLLAWWDRHGRKDLPWQRDRDPYRVWVSEIMLQQTQVQTVIPYFERFMTAFPTVTALAAAPEDAVMHAWSGLGYYARARNLHGAAKRVAKDHGGEIPRDFDALLALPGIGRSTAGAIASFCFDERRPILDGNVKRVLARYHRVDGWPGASQVAATLWRLAEASTPNDRVGDYTQAIMDLGATVCVRKRPACRLCPLADGCALFDSPELAQFPGNKPAKTLPERRRTAIVLRDAARGLWLVRRPNVGVWGGLWSFPECPDGEDALAWFKSEYGVAVTIHDTLPISRHTFSHYRLLLTPVLAAVTDAPADRVAELDAGDWYDPEQADRRGLAAPVRRFLAAEGDLDRGIS